MSNLSYLLEKYPGLYYDQDHDTFCVDINEDPMTIETDASELIESYFEGRTVSTGDNTDPDSEEIALTGKDYVKYQLGGVIGACEEIGIEVI